MDTNSQWRNIFDNHGTKWGDFPWWNYWRIILLIREAHQNIRMSTLKRENHIIDVIDYHIIYIYYIYTYFTSSQFFQVSKHPMLWTTKSFRRHFWGIRSVAASSGEYRRSCLGSCYKMLKHTSVQRTWTDYAKDINISRHISYIHICNYIESIYLYHIII